MNNLTLKYIDQLNQLWNREDFKSDPQIGNLLKRGYSFPEIEKATVLFVGLNPSGKEDAGNSCIYTKDQAIKDLPNYYGKYDKLANKANVDWSYLDIFFFKETDSNLVDTLLKQAVSVQFLVEQLKITQAIIEEISPKIIVVFNAKARKFFGLEQNRKTNEGIWMGYSANDKILNRKFGTPVITEVESDILIGFKHKKSVPIPVFFDSFITYQSSAVLDRLAWHIDFVRNLLVQE